METPNATLTFAQWIAALSREGYGVLAASHAVPVQLWLQTGDGAVLHFLARGTRLTLRAYDEADLTALILRSECDCEEHRTAGAGVRTVLTPGAVPTAETAFDGATELGWTSVEAGLVDIAFAAEVFAALREEIGADAGRAASGAAVA